MNKHAADAALQTQMRKVTPASSSIYPNNNDLMISCKESEVPQDIGHAPVNSLEPMSHHNHVPLNSMEDTGKLHQISSKNQEYSDPNAI